MLASNREVRSAIAAVVLLIIARTSASAQDEFALQKLSSSAYSFHDAEVAAINVNLDTDGDIKGYTSNHSTYAVVTTENDHATAEVQDPHASATAYGRTYAMAGNGSSKITSGYSYRFLECGAEAHASSNAELTHISVGEVLYKVPTNLDGNPWFTAEIDLFGFGQSVWKETDDFHVHIGCMGEIRVGRTKLEYLMYDDDGPGDLYGMYVWGKLQTSGGEIDINDHFVLPGPVHYYCSEYTDPGDEFTVYVSHMTADEGQPQQEEPWEIHTEGQDGGGGWIFGVTYAKVSHLQGHTD